MNYVKSLKNIMAGKMNRMDRRQFIKSASVVLGTILVNPLHLLHRGTEEMPVRLGNPSIAWRNEPTHKWGIKSNYTLEQIALSLDDGRPVAARLEQLGHTLAAARRERRCKLSELFLRCPIKNDIARILADSPGMSREDAFLQAVMERAA